FYYYVTIMQGYVPFTFTDRKQRRESFTVMDNNTSGATQRGSFSASVTDYRWVIKDVPPIKEESYTSTVRNHISRLEFQLAEAQHPFIPRKIMSTWPEVAKRLLEDASFGYAINRGNGWLNDVMGDATLGASKDLEKARNIFAYVRDNMTCTNYNRRTIDKNLKDVLKRSEERRVGKEGRQGMGRAG